MLIFSQLSRSFKLRKKGFTLIELLVVMSIMVIVTSVLMLRQSKFDSSTLLRSLAYSVALSVRQSQLYGTSVFGTTTSSSAYCNTGTYSNGSCFAPGYGIYVSYPNGGSPPTSYTLFADLNNDGTYNTGEDVKVFNLGNGYSISNICAANNSGTQSCAIGSGGLVTSLSIFYRRPNPEACMSTNLNSSCGVGATAFYATSSIQIQANGADAGSTRSIIINSTGQISVGNAGT